MNAPFPNIPLPPDRLYTACDLADFAFDTTDDIPALSEMRAQSRAIEAVELGVGMRHTGFNLFVLGMPGSGRHAMVSQFLQQRALAEPAPASWCYANNFSEPTRAVALRLPHGHGERLRDDMQTLVKELLTTIPAMFESEDYRSRVDQLDAEFNELQKRAFIDLAKEAEAQSVALMRTPEGFSFAAEKNGEVLTEGQYEELSAEEKEAFTAKIAALQKKLEKLLLQVLEWRKAHRDRLRQLNREVTIFAVGSLVEDMVSRYRDFPDVVAYLESVRQDVIENAHIFRQMEGAASHGDELPPLRRYQINVLLDGQPGEGAPVVFEDNPTFQNLFGRIEHIARFGNLVTDFLLIRPGSLHRANGGYLMVDIHQLLSVPFAWEGLKRALTRQELRIESLLQTHGMVSTVSLEPQPIPLDVKVILFGERIYYYLLQMYDPDFGKLFKIAADFEDDVARNGETQQDYARLVAGMVRDRQLLPFNRSAIARIIEQSARDTGDAGRLSLHMQRLSDLLHEADYWARMEKATVVAPPHVQQAIDAKIRRSDRIRRRLFDEILRGTVMIDSTGARVGQVNGLSVLEIGDYAFGLPTRITATTRLGDGEVIDIQREVALAGAIHSKGVLILSSFLAARYAARHPLSLTATLVFEQTYAHIDGDSASMAELCALLSSLSDAPIRQSLAITGSVNQYGEAQAIGGVNEKIEGYFDLCAARGLTGEQGVLIPAANATQLMLRADVIAAAAEGKFHIHAINDVDQAIEILTGIPAGRPDGVGDFAPGSINQRVRAKLAALLQIRLSLPVSAAKKRRRQRTAASNEHD